MRLYSLLPLLLIPSLPLPFTIAHPSPIKRLNSNNSADADSQVLNFLLTLEHLERAFYLAAPQKYSAQGFVTAGYTISDYGRFRQMGVHEASHVEFLESSLAAARMDRVQPCVYSFPDNDPKLFVAASLMLENVVASAYNAALAYIKDKAYLAAAASIFGVESRHASFVSGVPLASNPWNTAYETPLSMNQILTLISLYTQQCPASNAALLPASLQAFPQLTIDTHPTPSQSINLTFAPPAEPLSEAESLFVAWISGMGVVVTQVEGEGQLTTQVPADMADRGAVYVLVVRGSKDMSNLRMDDASTVAGPAFVVFPFGGDA
ncbi:uncharacterized protein LACBIDRAFT_310865 [Laccaria bicolor S238N-H82]|uniref:Predicted protein n=1 Tax=Laccaria bicolor (strain S238N-H82 / ATCC MYA-4686) TaxID=486041 RepID=B0DV96_LACBS|nr:uncharacterized protein LACBIDRAFT_310865 [Laccaria bicolor S238N-H82]EDR01539.1 predicted protein [Laccaria bicolor S238N-H82]|eukprot:XP_001887891.1 predicted protein [Laccaria bicolor S238N-H82]